MTTRMAAAWGVAALAGGMACAQPSARPYAGDWTRASAEGGAVRLTIRPTGAIELRLAAPPRPADSLMKGPAAFRADTLTFTGAPCQQAPARYYLRLDGNTLTVAPLDADGCALRRRILSGSWTRG